MLFTNIGKIFHCFLLILQNWSEPNVCLRRLRMRKCEQAELSESYEIVYTSACDRTSEYFSKNLKIDQKNSLKLDF